MRHLPIPNVGVCPLVCIVILFGVGVPLKVLATDHIPVKVTGDLTYEYRQESEETGPDVMQHLTSLNVNAHSYIWQPWFAQITGKLNLSWDEIKNEQDTTNDEIVTGAVGLYLLPQSRFPLDMNYDKTNSRVTGDQISRSYTNTHYGVMQRYRNPRGTMTANIGYDHNSQVSDNNQDQEDSSDIIHFNASQRLEKHFFQLNTDSNKIKHKNTDEFVEQQGSVLRHRYKPGSTFTVENMISVVDNNDNTGGLDRQLHHAQASSYFFWRPQAQSYMVNGGVRYYGLVNEGDIGSSKTNNLYAHTALSYKISSKVRMTANATRSETETGTANNVVATQTINLSYRPQSIQLGEYMYNWDTAGGVRNRSGGEDEGQQYTLQLGHTIQRNLTTGSHSNMNYNFSQRISEELDSVLESRTRLTHTGSVSWQHSRLGKNTYIKFLATDSRSRYGQKEEIYQFANLQFSGHINFKNSSSLNGTLSIQGVHRTNGNTSNKELDTHSSANLVYRHYRAFDVPRLRFTSDLKLNAESVLPVAFDEDKTQRNVWENRLDYSIGRLDLRLSYRKSTIKRNRHDLLMFRLKRWFD